MRKIRKLESGAHEKEVSHQHPRLPASPAGTKQVRDGPRLRPGFGKCEIIRPASADFQRQHDKAGATVLQSTHQQ